MYKVYDKVGKFICSFPTRAQALTFLSIRNRYDWKIIRLYSFN